MNILAIGGHPDDIEYGCGGTLLQSARKGHRVYLFVATEGGEGGDGQTRRREQGRAAELLGVERITWGGYRDTEVPMDKGLISKIEAVVKDVQPGVIFCHSATDTHQDHRTLCAATISAARHAQNVLLYEGPSTYDFCPTVYSDIGDVLEAKLELLRAYESQVDKTGIENLNITAMASSNANFRGIQARVKYAEGFLPVRLMLDV